MKFRHSVSDVVSHHDRLVSFFELDHQPRTVNANNSHNPATEEYEMAIPIAYQKRTVEALPGQADVRSHWHKTSIVHGGHRQRSVTASFGVI